VNVPLCTLVDDDVDTAHVTLGSGRPGIWAGSSCGMSIGGKSHHDHVFDATFGSPRHGTTSSVTSVPTAKQAQTASGPKHFMQRICDQSFLKLASPDNRADSQCAIVRRPPPSARAAISLARFSPLRARPMRERRRPRSPGAD
jgi:hypothetical protein